MAKFLDESGLLYFWGKIKAYVDSHGGGGGDTNVIETVKVNGTALTPDANKAVDVTVPTQASDVGAAASSHAHGNITSGGDMTATAAIASGDRLVINDESASKLTSSTLTFGSNTSQYLSNAGSWQSLPSSVLTSKVTVGGKDFSSTSLTSGTAKSLTASSGNKYATIPAGKWVVMGMVRFNSNATGRRECWLSTSDNGTSAIMQSAKTIIPAANGDQTFAHFMFTTSLDAAANYYLVAKQNSGSSINALGYVRWFGIAS